MRPRGVSLGAVVVGLWLLVAAAPAGAAVTCAYDQNADVLTITADANGDRIILGAAVGGEIGVFDAVANVQVTCSGAGGPPTVNNTSNLNLTDTGVDTSWGLGEPENLVPGSGGTGEIETLVALGSGFDSFTVFDGNVNSSNDFWVLGAMGINWNGDMDVDVTFLGSVDQVTLAGNDGNDALTARGADGTGAQFPGPGDLAISGGGDTDVVEGADTNDELLGGPGDDTVRGFGGNDNLEGDTGTNQLVGGADEDRADYGNSTLSATVDLNIVGPQDTGVGIDTLVGIEGVNATDQADVLIGTGGANPLNGRGGDDLFDGRGGNDLLIGQDGVDTATYAHAPAGVTADLTAGTASGGAGDDTLFEIDDLIGSPFADNLTGNALANAITGLGGNDTISALAGPDAVDVRDGGLDTASCGSEIDTATADRATVDNVNADCETTSFLPEPVAAGGGGDTAGGGGGGVDVDGAGGVDTELSFDLSGKRQQRIVKQKGVLVMASCPLEACTAVASGAGKLPKPKRAALAKLTLKPVTEALAAGVAEQIKLRLRKKRLRAVKAALAAGKKPKVTVTANVTDAAGNAVTDKLTVKAKR